MFGVYAQHRARLHIFNNATWYLNSKQRAKSDGKIHPNNTRIYISQNLKNIAIQLFASISYYFCLLYNVTSTNIVTQNKTKTKAAANTYRSDTPTYPPTTTTPCFHRLVTYPPRFQLQFIAFIDFKSLRGIVHQKHQGSYPLCLRTLHSSLQVQTTLQSKGAFIIVIGVGLCALVFTRSFRTRSKT